jgi:hypothetical protein
MRLGRALQAPCNLLVDHRRLGWKASAGSTAAAAADVLHNDFYSGDVERVLQRGNRLLDEPIGASTLQ